MNWLTSKRFGLIALGVTLTMEVVCAVLIALGHSDDATDEVVTSLIAIPTFALLATVGAVILSRQPWHGVGLVFALCPPTMMAANVASFYYYATTPDEELPGRVVAALLGNVAWLLGAGSAALFLPLLFPTGRYLSPRWRVAGMVGALGLVIAALAGLLRPGPLDDFDQIVNPIGVSGIDGLLDALQILGFALVASAVIAGLASMVLRFKRARGVEREQIKWVLASSTWAVWFFGVFTPIVNLFGYYPPDLIFLTTIALIPASVAVAMLRYRLYDIDRIINRTLVYGLLTAGLGALYAALVVGLQEVLQSVSGGSDLAIVVTTLTVAALFLPARRRVQVGVDRRFNRRQYDSSRTIDAFSQRLRQHVELDMLRHDLLGVIDETMAPTSKSLWLRPRS